MKFSCKKALKMAGQSDFAVKVFFKQILLPQTGSERAENGSDFESRSSGRMEMDLQFFGLKSISSERVSAVQSANANVNSPLNLGEKKPLFFKFAINL